MGFQLRNTGDALSRFAVVVTFFSILPVFLVEAVDYDGMHYKCTAIPVSGAVTDIVGVALGPGENDLFITDWTASGIYKTNADGSDPSETKVSGDGTDGNGDAVGLAASWHNPVGIIHDSSRNVFYSATHQHVIRQFTDSTQGTPYDVTTICGQYTSSNNADGLCSTTTTKFNVPSQMTLDHTLSAGVKTNLYIADQSNSRIRRIDLTTMTTYQFAGSTTGFLDGTGTSARFYAPKGICLTEDDASLYVADTSNRVLRHVNVATQQVTKIAGLEGNPGTVDGDALTVGRVDNPIAIVVAPRVPWNEIVYFSQDSGIVRALDKGLLKGIIGKVWNSGTTDGMGVICRLTNPKALALSTDGYTLYIGGSNRLVKVDVTYSETKTETRPVKYRYEALRYYVGYLNQQRADDMCASRGAYLASFQTLDDWEQFKKDVDNAPGATNMLIGAHDMTGSNHWVWKYGAPETVGQHFWSGDATTGSCQPGCFCNFQNAANGGNKPIGGGSSVVARVNSKAAGLWWINVPDNDIWTTWYVCQYVLGKTRSQTKTETRIDKYRYEALPYTDGYINQQRADDMCASRGAYLASIETLDDWEQFKKDVSATNMLIGAHDMTGSNHWVWKYGAPETVGKHFWSGDKTTGSCQPGFFCNFQNVANGGNQPSGLGPVAVVWSKASGAWWSDVPDEHQWTRWYVCQYVLGKTRSQTKTVTHEDRWRYAAYEYDQGGLLQAQAHTLCYYHGGYLATFRSLNDWNQFLADVPDTIPTNILIGASDVDIEGTWTWKYGPPATQGGNFWTGDGTSGSCQAGHYCHWNDASRGGTEPNNAGGNENVAIMGSKASGYWWSDVYDGHPNTKWYLCQFDGTIPPPTTNTKSLSPPTTNTKSPSGSLTEPLLPTVTTTHSFVPTETRSGRTSSVATTQTMTGATPSPSKGLVATRSATPPPMSSATKTRPLDTPSSDPSSSSSAPALSSSAETSITTSGAAAAASLSASSSSSSQRILSASAEGSTPINMTTAASSTASSSSSVHVTAAATPATSSSEPTSNNGLNLLQIAGPARESNTPLIALGAVLGLIVLLNIVALTWWLLFGRKRTAPKKAIGKSGFAPTKSPFAVVFVDVQNSLELWLRVPESEMTSAIDAFAKILRKLLVAHHGYEVTGGGDGSFMATFQEVESALRFGSDLQLAVEKHKWGSAGALLEAAYQHLHDQDSWAPLTCQEQPDEFDEMERIMFPAEGLRVRVAVDFGEGDIQVDEASEGYYYYGPVVNVAARLLAVSHGGQLLVTDQAAQASGFQPSSDLVCASSLRNDVEVRDLGPQQLKWVSGKTRVHQVTSKISASLLERRFPPLRLEREQQQREEAGQPAPAAAVSALRCSGFQVDIDEDEDAGIEMEAAEVEKRRLRSSAEGDGDEAKEDDASSEFENPSVQIPSFGSPLPDSLADNPLTPSPRHGAANERSSGKNNAASPELIAVDDVGSPGPQPKPHLPSPRATTLVASSSEDSTIQLTTTPRRLPQLGDMVPLSLTPRHTRSPRGATNGRSSEKNNAASPELIAVDDVGGGTTMPSPELMVVSVGSPGLQPNPHLPSPRATTLVTGSSEEFELTPTRRVDRKEEQKPVESPHQAHSPPMALPTVVSPTGYSPPEASQDLQK